MEREEPLGETLNFSKLKCLVEYVTQQLRKLLLEKWKKKLDREWDGSPASVSFLKEAIGQKELERATFYVQRNIEAGDIGNWDLTTFSEVIRALNSQWVSEEEKKRIEEAERRKNEILHHPNWILQFEFDKIWQTLIDLLPFLGVSTEGIAIIEMEINSRIAQEQNRINWDTLSTYMDKVKDVLLKLFSTKWKEKRGKECDDEALKTNLKEEVCQNTAKDIRKYIKKRIVEWDLTAITKILRSLKRDWFLDGEKTTFENAARLRNALCHEDKEIGQKKFRKMRNEVFDILTCLNVSPKDINQIYSDDQTRYHCNQFSLRFSNDHANELKEKGSEALRIADYVQAIKKFEAALNVPSLKEAEKGVLFCDRSAAFLQMAKEKSDHERKNFAECAENDAKKAARLQPMWFKAHLHLGDAYKLLEKYEEAITTYNKVLSLDPSLEVVRIRRNECRQELAQRQRQDHMDTMDTHPLSIEVVAEQITQNNKEKITQELQQKYLDVLKKIAPDLFEITWFPVKIDIKADFEKVVNYCSTPEKREDALATYVLARLTKKGLGIKKDYRRALELFKQAAKMPPMLSDLPNEGVLPAMHCIAMMCDEGVAGVEMDSVTAFRWYKDAADLGFSPSANNLAVMYILGKGVSKEVPKEVLEQDSVKAEHYWNQAAQARSMHSLAGHYLKTGDAGQARTLFKFAVEGGDILAKSRQQEFEAACRALEESNSKAIANLEKWEKENNPSTSSKKPDKSKQAYSRANFSKKAFKDGMVRIFRSADMHNFMEKHNNCRRQIAVSPTRYTNVYECDYSVIAEYASKDRVYAQQFLKALKHFLSASLSLNNYKESSDAGEVDSVIIEAARCFATAEFVSYFGKEDRNLLMNLVEQKLNDLKDQICDKNRYARQCYAFLQLPSYKEYVPFLKECIARYPEDRYFYLGYLEKYDEGKKVAQNGLDLSPKDSQMTGSKACSAIDGSQDKAQKASDSLNNYKESSDAGDVDSVIKEAARYFATAEYVSYFGDEDRNLLMKLVEQKLADLKDQICEKDRYARQCYAFLQLPSYKEYVTFLKECIARYPKDPYFYDVLACTHGYLEQYDEGKKVAQNGLDLCPEDSQIMGSKACSAIDGSQDKEQKASDLFPKNFELMYSKAYLTFLAFDGDQGMQNVDGNKGMQDVIDSYETFLKHAPSDHRKVPEACYSMALLTLTTRSQNNDASIEEKVRAYYDKGLESEKQLLPCFLPYEDLSKTKSAVGAYLETKEKNLKKSEQLKKLSNERKKNEEKVTKTKSAVGAYLDT